VSPVLRIWRDVLDAPGADDDADFFELGGDSLAAVQVVSALEAELDRRVPVAAILTGRTPRGVAHALGLADAPHGPSIDDPILLTVLRPGTDEGPLVVMTASWDDVFGYQALARALPPSIRVVALGHTGGGHDGLDDVEGYVDAALDRCREEIGDRPVALVGWSAGGLVAVELARRLESCDVDVELVALVDTNITGEEQHLWSNRWWKYKSLLRPAAARPLAREVAATVRRRATQLAGRLRRRVRPHASASVPVAEPVPLGLSARFPAGVFRYAPPPIERPAVLYRASTTNPARTIERWLTVAPGLDDVVVEGRHRGFESIMAPDRVGVIAADLAGRFDGSTG
jgi:thioesterase domain-containing protein/acyl carrier protein